MQKGASKVVSISYYIPWYVSGATSKPSADQTHGILTKEAWPDYATSLIEVVRITLIAEMGTSPRYEQARTAIPTLQSNRNFSRPYQQVEHNASYFQ